MIELAMWTNVEMSFGQGGEFELSGGNKAYGQTTPSWPNPVDTSLQKSNEGIHTSSVSGEVDAQDVSGMGSFWTQACEFRVGAKPVNLLAQSGLALEGF